MLPMNHKRFMQVAGGFEKEALQGYCRNRMGPIEDLFTDWYSLPYTARTLKKTEEEYERYTSSKRSSVADNLNGEVGSLDDRPQYHSTSVVNCPHCGLRVGVQASKR